MLSWIKNLAGRTAAHVPAVLSVAAMGALALWGWNNDWQLSPISPRDQQIEKESAAGPAVVRLSASGPVRINFPSASAVEKIGIQVAPVQERAVTQSVTAPGMVDYEPGRYARLTARASGIVVRVEREIGDPVRKGDLLALLDAAEVGKAKADLLQGLAQVKLRSTTLQRMQKLFEQAALPESSLREAETALSEARIRLVRDQQTLLNFGLPVRLSDLQKLPDDQLARKVRLLGLPDAVARDLDPETVSANLLPLTAPFDGQVVERNVATGEVVQLAQPKSLFVVGDVRRLHIDLDVNPEDMALVRVGQRVTFLPNDGGPEAVARVSHLSPEVNARTRRVQVHAEVPNEDRRLRPNTFGSGQIIVAERPAATVVPVDAVQSDGPGSLVFVRVLATSFEARSVQPGLRQGKFVEVSGVRTGEEVVTRGSFLLKSELQKDRLAGDE
jgi:cobalt-zinc-cadmium efflux system membrane fusion protein